MIKPSFLFYFSLVVAGVYPRTTLASACCGGGVVQPVVIANDDKAQVTALYSQMQITDEVLADGTWRKRTTAEFIRTIKMEAAHILRDRWQLGGSIPVVGRTRGGTSSSGLGDLSGSLGYEYLPDWDYSSWRPKGVGFLQVTAPTGQSVQESDGLFQIESRGRGFWALGVGTVLTKVLGRWDVFASADVHRGFAKSYSNLQARGVLTPGYGATFGIGTGYNFSSLRLGSNITWLYEDPVGVSGSVSSRGSAQRYASFVLSGRYLFNSNWATTLSYSDQTLVGAPVNTTLGRIVTLSLQKRWDR